MTRLHKALLLAAALLLTMGIASGARADVFDVTATCPSCLFPSVTHGTITATQTGTPGVWDITAVSGNVGGNPLSLATLGTVPNGSGGFNDNLLYFPPSVSPTAYYDALGLGENVGNPVFGAVDITCGVTGCDVVNADIPGGPLIAHPLSLLSITPAAVPSPTIGAGLPGLIFASGGLLAWWHRKRRACEPAIRTAG
jgi:hypothetical protein